MKKVGRKVTSILLTLCMLLTMLPVSALAVDTASVSTDFTLEGTSDCTGSGWSWTNSTKTLMLTSETISEAVNDGVNDYFAFILPGGSTIALRSRSTVSCSNADSPYDIQCEGDLTITGDGTLNVEKVSVRGQLTVTGGATVHSYMIDADPVAVDTGAELNAIVTVSELKFDSDVIEIISSSSIYGSITLSTADGNYFSDLGAGITLMDDAVLTIPADTNLELVDLQGNGVMKVQDGATVIFPAGTTMEAIAAMPMELAPGVTLKIAAGEGTDSTPVYTVTFINDGQVYHTVFSQGDTIAQPAEPSKEGYSFGGWYKEDTLVTQWDFTADTVTANTTLYAKWEKETVEPAAGVAQIGDQTYQTLKAAFAAVEDNQETTITLLKDIAVSAPITIGEAKNVIFDMKGHTITAGEGFSTRVFTNNGTLTITGNGTIDVTAAGASGYGAVNNFGTLNVVDGTYKNLKESNASTFYNRNGGTATFGNPTIYGGGGCIGTEVNTTTTINGGYYENETYPAVENRGNMTITAGTFKNTSCSSCDGSKWGYTVRSGESSENAYLKIEGTAADSVKVTGVQGGLAVIGGTADIYNGVYETVACDVHTTGSSAFYAGYFTGESYETAVTIYDGTFQSVSKTAVLVGNDNPPPDSGAGEASTVMIKGGTFIGGDAAKTAITVDNTDYAKGGASISGGTFSSQPSEEFFAEGYAPEYNEENGTWGVVAETTYVAQIGENKYATLSEALNKVQDGETIKILAPATVNMTETYAITGKAITLNLNGQTVAWNTSAKEAITVKDGGKLTIQDTSANEAGELAFTSTYTDSGDSTGIYVNPNGTFALQSGTISYTAAKGRAIYVGGTGTFAMSGGTVKIAGSAKYGVYLSSNNSTNITGGEIILSDTLTETTLYGLYVYMLADAQGLAIENLTVDASAVPAAQCAYCITGGWNRANNAPVTISGGTYTTNENTLSKVIYYSTVKNLTISGGTFNGVVDSATSITDGTFQKAVKVTDTITGGTFEGDVTAPSGKISGGKFKVVNPPYDWNLADGKSFEQKDGYYCVVDDTNTKVAEVGDVQYATLEEAIKKAQSGQTVELLANATVLERIAIADKNITIDTNGYSVIYSGDADHKSAIIDLEGKAQVVVTGNGTFTFNNAYLDYNGFGYIFRLYDNSVLTIENGTYYAGLTCVQVGDSSAAYIKDGHFSASTDWKDTWWVLNRIDNNNSKFYVSGGTFVNYDPTNSDTESPTDNFCTPEYAATPTKDESGNTIYTVVEAEARIGETGYVTLADAIAAAEDNATITLLADVTEDVVVPAGKTITLDLNGYKITNAADHTIVNNGTLTITDSSEAKTGTVDNIAHGYAAIYNNGTMTIEAGTYTRSLETQDYVDDGADNSWYTVVNDGTMTIKGGTFTTADGQPENLGNRSSLVRNGDDATSNTGVTLTITGGQFISGANVIKNEQGSVIASISGGTFTMDNSRIAWYGGNNVIQTYGTITSITGGTFKALGDGTPIDQNNSYYRHGIGVYGEGKIENIGGTVSFEMEGSQNRLIRCDDTGSINITGGTYELADGEGNNNVLIYKGDETAKIAISGGTFSDEPDDAYLAEGYAPEQNDEGDWVVVEEDFVAEIVDGQKYESLIDAVNVAKVSGKTVKLLADVELKPIENQDYVLMIDANQSMTLDLNGHKITATLNNTEGFNLIENYGELTITDTSEGQNGSIEVTVNGSAEKSRTSVIYNVITGEFTLEAGTLKLTGSADSKKPLYGVYSTGITMVMDGGAIEVRRLNSDFEYSKAWDVYGIYNSNNCQTTVNGGKITVENQGRYNSAYGIYNASGTVSIHGDPNTPYIEANAFDTGTYYEHTLYGKITLYGGKYNMLSDTATGWIESDIIIAAGYEEQRNGDRTVSIIKSPVAQIGTTRYDTLEEAVAHVQPGETIQLLADVTDGSGIIVPSGSNFTIDFGGNTYTVTNNLAGSDGTQSQCFQLLRDSTITLKNGTIEANSSGISVIIQNYADLTLDGMTLDGNMGNNNVYDVLGVNHGNVTITGDTNITAKTRVSPSYAFDVYYWPENGYGDGVTVTVDENMTGTITGTILYGSDGTTAGKENVAEKAQLNIEAGTFVGQISTYNLDTDGEHGISISGGSFSEKPKEDYLAPYYKATQNTTGDGYWTVDVAANIEAIWMKTDGSTEGGMLSVLLANATSGTVQLLKDVTTTVPVYVNEGVTLDLAGKTLTSNALITFGGYVKDSTEGEGLLKVGVTRNTPNITIKENNPSLFIYDSEAAGYRLYSYTFKKLYTYTADTSGNSMGFYFQLTFENQNAWEELNTAETTHGVIMSTVLELSDNRKMKIYFDQSTIQGVASSIVGGATQTGKGFWLTVTGLDKLESGQTLTVTPTLEAAGEKLVINTEAFQYSKTASETN